MYTRFYSLHELTLVVLDPPFSITNRLDSFDNNLQLFDQFALYSQSRFQSIWNIIDVDYSFGMKRSISLLTIIIGTMYKFFLHVPILKCSCFLMLCYTITAIKFIPFNKKYEFSIINLQLVLMNHHYFIQNRRSNCWDLLRISNCSVLKFF